MISINVRLDTDDLPARINQSIRRFGNAQFLRVLEQWAIEANRHDALRSLDRHGRALIPWRSRKGRSDYHGRQYGNYTDSTTLIPFSRQSRRIDAFEVSISRRGFAGVGFGGVTLDTGFSARAGLVPVYWRRQGRDVLGLSPRTRKGFERLCTRHATATHRTLKRAGAAGRGVSRAAAAIGL